MNRFLFLPVFLFFFSISFLNQNNAVAQNNDKKKVIYYFKIADEISKPTVRTTQKALAEAKKINADIVFLHLNTYGGAVDAADSIRTALLNFPITTWVFIDNNAASAGALISISCDSIYMRKGANIGAATVVNQNAEAMPDKYQSYMRSMMRSTAEAQGRDPMIAQAMVDQDVYIENLSDSGKILTFTTSEAIKNNYCEGQAETIEEVIKLNGINNYDLVKQNVTIIDSIINFLISPVISGLLIMLIVGGIYFEMQTPGIGFALLVAVLAAFLYFTPLFLEGLAQNWELIIFILGVGLVILEIFVIPGFGIAGISGIVLIISGLALSMVENTGLSMPSGDFFPMIKSFSIVSISLFSGLILSFYLAKKLISTTIFGNSIALNDEFYSDKGYTAADNSLQNLIGKVGFAKTVLRPAGKIEVDGEHYDATAQIGFIDKGSEIEIVAFENMQLIVRKK